MPDLSHLVPLIPGLMTAVMGFKGDLLTDKERKYVRAFVRLTEKAINGYKTIRKYVIAQVEEKKRSPEEMERVEAKNSKALVSWIYELTKKHLELEY